METRGRTGGSVIAGTFLLFLILTVVALPDWMRPGRPEFIAMTLIYWCLAMPDRVGVGMGWLVGLTMDVAQGALLGQHALAFTFIAWITIKLHQRIRLFPIWQQALSVFLMLVLNQMIALWIKGIAGYPPQDWSYWLPSVTSMLLWPWFTAFMRTVRRYFVIA